MWTNESDLLAGYSTTPPGGKFPSTSAMDGIGVARIGRQTSLNLRPRWWFRVSEKSEKSPAAQNKVPPAPKGASKLVRISHLRQMKKDGRPITMLTAYDAQMAELADAGGVDVLLVGDSLGQVVHGMETTLPVTLEMMTLHTQAVVRGTKRALVVSDMPFMSCQVSPEETLRNAGRLLKEGGAQAVKIETCNERIIDMVPHLRDAGIPVMGHIGLTPQSIHALGGYKVQGRGEEKAQRLLHLARMIEEAGAFALVLELMPRDLARQITESLAIPTIGIGAGAECDGQVLVINDLIGLTPNPPKFARKYVDMRNGVLRAVRKFTRDVREGQFPGEEHEFE